MTANSSKSMLTQTLAPVALVIAFWFTMSGTTTYYLVWIERSNQRIFVENIVPVRAAEALQIAVWKIVSDFPVDSNRLTDFQLKCNEAQTEIKKQQQKLTQSAVEDEELAELSKLDGSLKELFECFNGLFDASHANEPSEAGRLMADERMRAAELANRISVSAKFLFEFNQAVVDEYREKRRKINDQIIAVRWSMLAIGPLLGVFLGWRLGLRLHRSIARISVTLNDAGSNSDSDIGSVAIESSGDFKDVEHQAEQVAERMRSVSRDLHSARREVLQSERLAAVGELAAGVAHEIRNPLTSVKLLLQHAIRNGAGPNLDKSKVHLILEEIGRMETTIQGLLDFSRPPKLNRVKHDLRQTLNRALNLLDARLRQQQIEVDLTIPDSPLIVDGDTEKLHQLLVNLLINAVEAMPDGGRLTIDATAVPNNSSLTSHVNSREFGDRIEDQVAQIVIRDTGDGIASEVLSRMFEPFASNKERGTGLGLAVSRRIAEEHCGTIRGCNGPDGGAHFTLTIPIADVQPVACLT